MKRPEIYVSWLSFPYSLLSVKMGARYLRQAGYEGLQGLPTHGLSADPMRLDAYLQEVNEILPIKLYESFWRDPGLESWGKADRRVFGYPELASIRYNALARLPEAQLIENHFGKSGLVEAQLGWLTPQQVADRARAEGVGLVFDMFHSRRKFLFGHQLASKPTGLDPDSMVSAWSNWQEQIELFGELVRYVHLQPMRNSDELEKWLRGEPTELEMMLSMLQIHCPNIQAYVVELPAPVTEDPTLEPPANVFGLVRWSVDLFRVLPAVRQKLELQLA